MTLISGQSMHHSYTFFYNQKTHVHTITSRITLTSEEENKNSGLSHILKPKF